MAGVLNRVLQSLREQQIPGATTQITDSYQLTLLEFFNQVREETEDACNWRALWQTFQVTYTAGQYYQVVTGTNERSRLVRMPIAGTGNQVTGGFYGPPVIGSDKIVPLVFDITSPSTSGNCPLQEMPLPALIYQNTAQNSQSVSQPQAFAMGQGNPDNAQADQNVVVLYIYPPPNNTRIIQVTLCVPENTYAATDVSRNIYVPALPIVHGLQWMAREERGEELGPNGMYTEERYRMTLDNAVSRELAEQGDTQDLAMV